MKINFLKLQDNVDENNIITCHSKCKRKKNSENINIIYEQDVSKFKILI